MDEKYSCRLALQNSETNQWLSVLDLAGSAIDQK